MPLTENSNQVFLPEGATNSQKSPYISAQPLDHIPQSQNTTHKHLCLCFASRIAQNLKHNLMLNPKWDYTCGVLSYLGASQSKNNNN